MVFSRLQANELGVSDVRLAGLLRRGYPVKVRRGVYARAVADPSRQRYLQASTAALTQRGPGHVLSHLSAATLWGLPIPIRPAETVHLTTTLDAPRSRRLPGLDVHHADSSEADFLDVDGVPVTSPARTAADCLRTFWPRVSVPIADAALNRGLTSIDEIGAQLATQRQWPGWARSKQSVAIVDGRRESWLESYTFVRFAEWELDLPEPQVSVFDEGGRFTARVDAGWLEDSTVLELDGKGSYAVGRSGVVDPEGTWRSKKERYDRVGDLGLERIRFGLDDLLHRDRVVRAQIWTRRRAGSTARFSGRFQRTPAAGLTLL
ncbi:MAG TPA: hypothetical protein VFR40_05230 [Lapillicoccus sp.]|nr:hypothetical protein [Lapillicoccus sp.]